MRDDRLLAYVRRATRAYDGSHDAEHAERVARNAARLCARADLRDVCVAAALAHDTCDPKYVADKEASLEALRTTLRTAARLPDARARLVVDVVREVSYTKLRTRGPPRHLGADAYYAWSVVADADMLEAMGVVGVLRTLMYQGYARRPLDAAVDYAEAHLVSCAEHMSHAAARAEAAERARTMRALLASMRDAHASARHLAHLCVHYGAHRRSFDELRAALAQRRYWDAPLRTAFAREAAWARDGDDGAPGGGAAVQEERRTSDA